MSKYWPTRIVLHGHHRPEMVTWLGPYLAIVHSNGVPSMQKLSARKPHHLETSPYGALRKRLVRTPQTNIVFSRHDRNFQWISPDTGNVNGKVKSSDIIHRKHVSLHLLSHKLVSKHKKPMERLCFHWLYELGDVQKWIGWIFIHPWPQDISMWPMKAQLFGTAPALHFTARIGASSRTDMGIAGKLEVHGNAYRCWFFSIWNILCNNQDGLAWRGKWVCAGKSTWIWVKMLICWSNSGTIWVN